MKLPFFAIHFASVEATKVRPLTVVGFDSTNCLGDEGLSFSNSCDACACGAAADPTIVDVAGGVAEVGTGVVARALALNAAM